MESQINSLTELIERARVEDYTGWYLEARKGQGDSLVNNFRMIFAAVKQHRRLPKNRTSTYRHCPNLLNQLISRIDLYHSLQASYGMRPCSGPFA